MENTTKKAFPRSALLSLNFTHSTLFNVVRERPFKRNLQYTAPNFESQARAAKRRRPKTEKISKIAPPPPFTNAATRL